MLTAAKVAEILGLSPRAVYDLAKVGRLIPAARHPMRFEPAAVEAFKLACRSVGRPAKPKPRPSDEALRAAVLTIGSKPRIVPEVE